MLLFCLIRVFVTEFIEQCKWFTKHYKTLDTLKHKVPVQALKVIWQRTTSSLHTRLCIAPIFHKGATCTPQECFFPWVDLDPHLKYKVPWAHKNLPLSGIFNQFIHFCIAHPCAQHTQTTEHATHVATGDIYVMKPNDKIRCNTRKEFSMC